MKKEAARSASDTGYPKGIGIGIAAAGILFMVFGIFRGEMDTVCSKAVQICLECIGIG